MPSPSLGKSPRSYSPIVVSAVFTVLATASVMLRLWARRLKKATLSGSDYAIFLALVFTVALAVTTILDSIIGGEGEHVKDLSASQLKISSKLFFAAEPLWLAACSAVKISILCLYLALFPNRLFHKLTYAVMLLVTCHCLGFILRTFLICRPVEYNWNRTIHATCGDVRKSSIAGGISNMILDITVIVLPMPIIWRLQMATKKKISITCIFGIGAFICVISILRLLAIISLNSGDLNYGLYLDGIWTFLEPSLGIVNASLPVLQPVLTRIAGVSLLARTRNLSSSKNVGRWKPWSHVSSNGEISGAGDSKQSKRLDEQLYPLTNISATQVHLKASHASDHNLDIDLESQHRSPDTPQPHDGILVTKTWHLQS